MPPISDSPLYRKAFVAYLRRGTPIPVTLERYLKEAERSTRFYIWRTRKDGKVRPSHAENDGRVFSWDDPPETGHPGTSYGCRCWAEPAWALENIDELPLEPFYPELLITPLLRIERLAYAWWQWLHVRKISKTWRLSPTKSEIKWRNRLEKGNWTPDSITNVIRYGKQVRVRNERTGRSATRYELDGKYVVIDDSSGHVLQLSGPNHIAKNF